MRPTIWRGLRANGWPARKGWRLISGEDATALGYMAHGGHGCISVTANVAPKLCADFQNACLAGDFAKALGIQDQLMPLHDAMFCEASPAPAKYARIAAGPLHR